MRKLRQILCLSALLLVALALTGCFNRQMLGFEVHDQKNVVLMETRDTHNYVFWRNHEHVYWTCSESNDTLSCTRRCGKGTDLLCPELSIFQNSGTSNVR